MVSTQSAELQSEPFTAGRLAKPTSDFLEKYVDAPSLESELKHLHSVLQVDKAHLVMLAVQGLVSQSQASSIVEQLEDLSRNPNTFTTKPGYGTLNLQIEEHLTQRLGHDTAGRLPIGRSRIDHGATVRRVSDRNSVLCVFQGFSTRNFWTLLACIQCPSSRLLEQLFQAYERMNRSPLGTVGLSGTELPINRQITATLLGFPTVVENSLTGRDAYYQMEIAFSLCSIMTLLNDLCSDLHIQSSTEFGYIELDDSHCSTSSIFPQKKNPVALEAVKAIAAESHGWMAASLAIFRNEGTGDQINRSVPFLQNACFSTANMLRLTAEVIEKVTINKTRCENALSQAWVTTSRLGNTLLLKQGADYRTAHGVVGRLVNKCLKRNIAPGQVTVKELQEAASEMGMHGINISQEELSDALDYRSFLAASNSGGGVGSNEFTRLLGQAKDRLQTTSSMVENMKRDVKLADERLIKAVEKLKEPKGQPFQAMQQQSLMPKVNAEVGAVKLQNVVS